MKQELSDKHDSLKNMCELMKQLPSQVGFYLLKNCFSIPKIMYLMRTSPVFAVDTEDIDTTIMHCIEALMNVSIDHKVWTQICLPIRSGGFGIQSPSLLAASAYASSYLACRELVISITRTESVDTIFDAGISRWRSQTAFNSLPPITKTKQKEWTTPVYNQQEQLLKTDSTAHDRARLLGCKCQGSGDWINTLSSSTLGLDLTNEQFRIASGLRLGAPICSTFKCVCGSTCQTNGHHALICPRMKSRIERHNLCNKVIKDSLYSAGIPSSLEPVGLLQKDGRRPDGHIGPLCPR